MQAFRNQLQALRSQYLKNLPAKIEEIRQIYVNSGKAGISPASWNKIDRQSHALAGSGSTFGCPDISELARRICSLCEMADTVLTLANGSVEEELDKLITELENTSQRYNARAGKLSTAIFNSTEKFSQLTSNAPLIYMVEDDSIYAENLATHIRVSGYRVQVLDSLDILHREVKLVRPDVIIMDMVLAEEPLAGAKAASYYAHTLHIPVVFVSVRSDMEARLAAVRAGASYYFVKPAECARIIVMLDQITSKPGVDRYHLMLVDDDIELLTLYTHHLEAAGMQVSAFNNPVEAWNNLESVKVELIVLDVNMPEMTGLELAALIRQMDEYNHVPIVFLSADSTIQTRLASMNLGADDFLCKPIEPEILVESLRARAARARTLRDGRLELQRTMRDLEFMRQAMNEHAIVALTDIDGRITYANHKFYEISGYFLHETLGQTHHLVKSGKHSEPFYEEMWQTISSGDVWHGIITNRAKNGHSYDVSTTIVPKLDEAGVPVQYLSVSTDITAIRMLEQENNILQNKLLQAAKMESIGHLTAGIAHDFNNLLGGILGFAELGSELLGRNISADNGIPDKVNKYLSHICTAGNRAKELITQMLLFSRSTPEMENGKIPSTLLQPVVKEVVYLLRSSIPSTIEINCQIEEPYLHSRIRPVQLHQLLMNSIINARDAMGEYGRIQVSLSRHANSGTCSSCHHSYDSDYVELKVSDSGPGIPQNLLSKIFDPFFTTKEVGKGTGMGLSVVHGIVHSLGGHIAVESVLNSGTIMRILLPEAMAQDQGVVEQNISMPDSVEEILTDFRLMVVDDEEAITSLLYEFLSFHGARVSTYNKPTQALSAFELNPDGFDLVVSDEAMPDLSGLDMAKRMLHIKPDLPVILCTGYSEHVNAEIAKQNGISEFMYKPLEMPKLLGLIQEFLNPRPH